MNRATHTTTSRRVLGAAAALALAVTLSGCSLVGGLFGEGNVFTIKVGDCFNEVDPGAEEISNVKVVSCTEPHDFEATKSIILTETEHPGDDVIKDRADSECFAAFSEYSGQTYEAFTDYDYTFYWPTTGSWSTGDREILCLIGHVDGQSTGSVKNFAG